MPSQWGLQYFPFSGAGQVQAAFAHFLGLVIILLLPVHPAPFSSGRPIDTMLKPAQKDTSANSSVRMS
jgi:hypothetical protein